MHSVIGLVGPIASGKGTVAQILKELGFEYYSLSDRIREELVSRGLPITRQYLQDVGDELRGSLGADILAVRTTGKIDIQSETRIVIDSIRNPAEIGYLKEHLGAKIVGVNASPEVRYDRLVERNRGGEPLSREEFLAMDARETEKTTDSHKIDISGCLELADYVIANNGTPDDLMEGLTRFFRETRETPRRRKEGQ
jgi:dephospho-CoA kinase